MTTTNDIWTMNCHLTDIFSICSIEMAALKINKTEIIKNSNNSNKWSVW